VGITRLERARLALWVVPGQAVSHIPPRPGGFLRDPRRGSRPSAERTRLVVIHVDLRLRNRGGTCTAASWPPFSSAGPVGGAVSYGRTGRVQRGARDQPLAAAGAALIFVGAAESILGFILLTEFTCTPNGGCSSYDGAGPGMALLVVGIVVLIAGTITYLFGRRPEPV
jgi:hypothetical protein